MTPRELAAKRWRTVAVLSAPLIALYLAFTLLIAFGGKTAVILVAPGVTLAMLLAALVIAATWLTTWLYVRWADRQVREHSPRPRTDGPA
jgi:uncharacterized membrane protein (DUF485 family)